MTPIEMREQLAVLKGEVEKLEAALIDAASPKQLYLFERGSVDYDEYDAHLVRATSEHEARLLCAKVDIQFEAWGSQVEAVVITNEGCTDIIISSYNAG